MSQSLCQRWILSYWVCWMSDLWANSLPWFNVLTSCISQYAPSNFDSFENDKFTLWKKNSNNFLQKVKNISIQNAKHFSTPGILLINMLKWYRKHLGGNTMADVTNWWQVQHWTKHTCTLWWWWTVPVYAFHNGEKLKCCSFELILHMPLLTLSCTHANFDWSVFE